MESKFFQTDLGTIRYWVSRMQPQMPWLVFLPGLTAGHTLFEEKKEEEKNLVAIYAIK